MIDIVLFLTPQDKNLKEKKKITKDLIDIWGWHQYFWIKTDGGLEFFQCNERHRYRNILVFRHRGENLYADLRQRYHQYSPRALNYSSTGTILETDIWFRMDDHGSRRDSKKARDCRKEIEYTSFYPQYLFNFIKIALYDINI